MERWNPRKATKGGLAVAIVGSMVGAAGCVAWHSSTARNIDPFPPANSRSSGQPASIAIEMTFQVVGMMYTDDMRHSAVDNVRGWGQDIFEKTGWFTVSNDPKTSDYRLVLNVRDDADPNSGLAIIWVLSLMTIPVWASDNFTTQAELVAADGQRLGERRLSHQMNTVMEILLFPATPFAFPKSVERRMWRGVLQDLAVWSHETIEARAGGHRPPPSQPDL